MTCPRSLREAQDRSLPLHKLADEYVKVVGLGDVLYYTALLTYKCFQ